jgi:hypothetical protein
LGNFGELFCSMAQKETLSEEILNSRVEKPANAIACGYEICSRSFGVFWNNVADETHIKE